MPSNALATIEQSVVNIGRRHADFPVEFAMVLRLIKFYGGHMANSAHFLLKAWGVTYAEYSLLSMLYGSKGHALSMADLCTAVGENPGPVTRSIRLLHKRGLVVRNHDKVDRRKVTVVLDKKGVTLVQTMLPVLTSMTNDYLRSFAPGEVRELLRLLRKSITSMA
jgi:DNA-binding MarR family transcriptional regulator